VKRLGFLFPGQGAQHVGMGSALCDRFATARRTFEEADQALGLGLSALAWGGPEEKLTLTENAQPALLTMSVAIARVLAERGFTPAIAAGHSLGEWSAWVAVGAIDFAAALRAVRLRGKFMQDAVPLGVGAMSALLGADVERVTAMCAEAGRGEEQVVPANLNGGRQIVVAGHAAAVTRLEELAGGERIRAVRLKVSAPFHSPLMAPAAERMGSVLASIAFAPPRAPVVCNVDARPCSEVVRIAPLLREQITAPVRWEDCARAVAASSDVGVEVGPGQVLAGLMKRIERDYACHTTGEVPELEATLAALRAEDGA
jgi:[acyl-carrier-protein] S-malonyltransferase